MRHPSAGKPIGILNPEKGKQNFILNRYLPSNMFQNLIEHYWIVKWDLQDKEPYVSETLPHPSVHLVFEKNNTKVYGIQERKFSVLLEGKGAAIGVKFNAGGFFPFFKRPVSMLKNKIAGTKEIFGRDFNQTEVYLLSLEKDDLIVHETEKFILELFKSLNPYSILPFEDDTLSFILEVTTLLRNETNIINVEQAAERFNVSIRKLQRMFYRYVGVTPKWVIKRFRLHNAAEKLASKQITDLASIAVQSGYYDQAHFIKDFKSIIGKSPLTYIKEL